MSFSLTDIERHKLENGLTIVTRESHTVPIVTTMIWYRLGSRHEQPGCTGASHFLEHMMFKGTKRLSKGEIDHITTRLGGFNNAFTSLDYTAYYFSFASDRWRSSLEVEADRMCNSHFDAIEFELERNVILEELRMEQDQPWEVLRQAVASAAFRKHPYRFPIIGLIEDVAQLTIPDIQQLYEQYYLPSNATLVIAGDFETQTTLNYVQDLFGPIPTATPPRCPTYSESGRSETIKFTVDHPTTIPRIMLGLPTPAISDKELYAFQILDKLLCEGKLSRLFQRLVEKEQMASMITSEICETRDPFLLLLKIDAREDSNLVKLESALQEELRRLTQETPMADEMERAKKQCTSHYLNDLETTSDQAFNIGLFETLNRLDVLTEYCERTEAVTAEEVTAVADRYLGSNEIILGSMLPK